MQYPDMRQLMNKVEEGDDDDIAAIIADYDYYDLAYSHGIEFVRDDAYNRFPGKVEAIVKALSAEPNMVREGDDIDAQSEQVAAISQLIADRTEDENSPSKLSTEAFVGLINKMGLPMTQQTLMDLVEKGQLQSIIKDVNQDEVQFKGQQDVDPTAMSVDKAKDVVAGMAKRAAKKGIMK